MTTPARQAVGVVFLLATLLFTAHGAAKRLAAPADGAGRHEISAQERAAGLEFAPDVAPGDQQAIVNAILAARPEAQRLIGIVDGLATIRIADPGGSALGVTESGGGIDGYRITLNLNKVYEQSGKRGISRLVLHELGHVIDHALLTEDLQRTLDAGIPAGAVCEEGVLGACAAREERFAESFAKWATGDIGFNLYIGYKIPPPPQLDVWGAPLASVK